MLGFLSCIASTSSRALVTLSPCRSKSGLRPSMLGSVTSEQRLLLSQTSITKQSLLRRVIPALIASSRLPVPSSKRVPRPIFWVYLELLLVGPASRTNMTFHASKPSINTPQLHRPSRSPALNLLIRPFLNRYVPVQNVERRVRHGFPA